MSLIKSLRKFVGNSIQPTDIQPQFATVTQLNPLRVRLDGAGEALVFAPAGLVLPTEVGQRVWVVAYGRQVVLVGVVGGLPYQTPLEAGVDYQEPLVPDVDYQTPLEAGVDYQTPLAAVYTNPWWASQNGWGVLSSSHIYRCGPVVSMVLNVRSPTTSTAIAANGAAVVAYLTNSQVAPPINATFAWRAITGQGGFGEFNTAGIVALGSPTAITLPASTSVFFTINFIKP